MEDPTTPHSCWHRRAGLTLSRKAEGWWSPCCMNQDVGSDLPGDLMAKTVKT